jgi:alpha-L-fucosidase
MKLLYPLLSALVLASTVLAKQDGTVPPDGKESSVPSDPAAPGAAHDAKMAWFRDAKFGMFIHWGVYAVPAGIYKGREISTGTGEWIMNYARIPVAEYRLYGKSFDPVKYDPAAWAALAKEAGMKYLVITSKHHDGFALFDSKASDWNVVKATPYGKDLIAPLAQAVRAEGLKFGLYYSHDLDWSYPGGGGYMMEQLKNGKFVKAGEKWDKAQEGSFDDYLRDKSIPQVRELLDTYHPDMIWWDYNQNITPERAAPFVEMIKARPSLISNDRLGGGFKGDLGTPEQQLSGKTADRGDWELCMTMNETWGFKTHDHEWKSSDQLIRKLSEVVCKGGNFLLNVGPTAEGTIPPESVERLRAIGAWLKINGEAVYGTRGGPIRVGSWGGSCHKGNKIFLHVCTWPTGRLALDPLPYKVIAARTLTGAPVTFHQDKKEFTVQVAQADRSAPVTVVELTLDQTVP